MTRRRPAPTFETREHRAIARLVAICERIGTTADENGQQHLDNREQLNHLGVCSQLREWIASSDVVRDGSGFRPASHTLSGTCAPSCQEWHEALAEGRAILAESQRTPLEVAS
jgi:hypothetical protein